MSKGQKVATLNKAIALCFVLLTVPLVAIRTIELLYYTNLESGFYNGPEQLNVWFFGLIIAMFIIYSILTMLNTTRCEYKFYKHKNLILKALLIICAVIGMVYSVHLIASFTNGDQKHTLISILNILLSAMASIGFIYMFGRLNKRNGSYADILSIFPALWSIVQLFTMFMEHMAVTTVYENTINILRASFLSICMLNFAKIICGADQKNTGKWLIFSGLSASTLGLVSTISHYLHLIIPAFTQGKMGEGYTNPHIMTATPFDLALTLLALTATFKYIKDREIVESGEIENK